MIHFNFFQLTGTSHCINNTSNMIKHLNMNVDGTYNHFGNVSHFPRRFLKISFFPTNLVNVILVFI